METPPVNARLEEPCFAFSLNLGQKAGPGVSTDWLFNPLQYMFAGVVMTGHYVLNLCHRPNVEPTSINYCVPC